MNKIKKNGYTYLEISDDFSLSILKVKDFNITTKEFCQFIKQSNFKNQIITCNIMENDNEKKIILNNLGFSFDGVEFNPENNEIEELYSYNYKEEFFIKDNVLTDILQKLDIK